MVRPLVSAVNVFWQNLQNEAELNELVRPRAACLTAFAVGNFFRHLPNDLNPKWLKSVHLLILSPPFWAFISKKLFIDMHFSF